MSNINESMDELREMMKQITLLDNLVMEENEVIIDNSSEDERDEEDQHRQLKQKKKIQASARHPFSSQHHPPTISTAGQIQQKPSTSTVRTARPAQQKPESPAHQYRQKVAVYCSESSEDSAGEDSGDDEIGKHMRS